MQPAEHQTSSHPDWMARRGLFLPILFFFVCLFLFFKLNGPLHISSTQNAQNNYFIVDGTGEVKGTPNSAEYYISVSANASTQEQASSQMNVKTNKIITDIKALGIPDKDIKTTNLQTNVNYGPDLPQNTPLRQQITDKLGAVGSLPINPNPQPSPNGYITSQTIDVIVTNASLAGKVYDTANRDGATGVSGPTYTLSDESRKKLEEQAQAAAIKEAKQKAQKLTSQSGLRLGRLVNVQTNSYRPLGGYAYAMNKTDAAPTGDTTTNPQPGENSVSVTVTLSYETR